MTWFSALSPAGQGKQKRYTIPFIHGSRQGLWPIQVNGATVYEYDPGRNDLTSVIVKVASKLRSKAFCQTVDHQLEGRILSQCKLNPLLPRCIAERRKQADFHIDGVFRRHTYPPSFPLASRSSAMSLSSSRSRPARVCKPVSGSNFRSS